VGSYGDSGFRYCCNSKKETFLSWLILFLCLVPTLVEAYLDRNGENRTGKTKDTLWLIASSLLFALICYLFKYNPIAVLALILGWRILVFNYLVNYLLYKNKVTEKPEARKWWSYSGETSWIDRQLSRVNWIVIFAARVVLFGLALWYYLI